MDPLISDAQKRSLARLDIPTLVDRANTAIEEGDYDLGVLYIRTAVRRSPLRKDLRDMLTTAIEYSVGVRGSDANVEPFPAHQPTGRPPEHFDEDDAGDFDDDPRDDIRLEELRADEEEEYTDADIVKPLKLDRRGGRRPLQSSYQQRHRRGPASAWVFGALTAIALMVLVTFGIAWVFYGFGGAERTDSGNAGRNDRGDLDLIDIAREHETNKEYAQAIETLERLDDGPEKERLLAESYARQGRMFTLGDRYNDARDRYERALLHDPENPDYLYDLGEIHRILGNDESIVAPEAARDKFQKAEEYFQQSLLAKPNDLHTLDGLAKVEFARLNPTAAAGYLQKIIDLAPESPEAEEARVTLRARRLRPDPSSEEDEPQED